MNQARSCNSCAGSGALPTDYGLVDCPDCGGAGYLPSRHVHSEWRARDIERGLAQGKTPDAADIRWVLAELRTARDALTQVIALAHDIEDRDSIGSRIRFVANRALGLYEVVDERRA